MAPTTGARTTRTAGRVAARTPARSIDSGWEIQRTAARLHENKKKDGEAPRSCQTARTCPSRSCNPFLPDARAPENFASGQSLGPQRQPNRRPQDTITHSFCTVNCMIHFGKRVFIGFRRFELQKFTRHNLDGGNSHGLNRFEPHQEATKAGSERRWRSFSRSFRCFPTRGRSAPPAGAPAGRQSPKAPPAFSASPTRRFHHRALRAPVPPRREPGPGVRARTSQY